MARRATLNLIVVTGRNHPEWMRRCLDSIAVQTEPFQALVVDDFSDDPGVSDALAGYDERFTIVRSNQRRYGLANQVLAWNMLEPADDDIVVFVDLDDYLAKPDALTIVNRYYDAGAWLTYGSYEAVPAGHPSAATSRPAYEYPTHIRRSRGYRHVKQYFNHLRTISWKVLKHVTEEDLRRDDGQYWQADVDRAVMFPAMELAADRVAFIPDILYHYRCDSPDAVWRTQQDLLLVEDAELRRRPQKEALV